MSESKEISMSEETKDITVISREEAIKHAVEYCKGNSKANVIPDTSNLCFGLGGLACVDANAEAPAAVHHFQINEDVDDLTHIPISDRVDLAGFFDLHGKEAMFDVNNKKRVCYLANVEKGLCAVVPFELMDIFKSVQDLVQSLKENNNNFFRGIIKDISDRAFDIPPSDEKITADPSPPKTQFTLRKETLIEVSVLDRVDLLYQYDAMAESKVVCVHDATSRCHVVVDLTKNTYFRISNETRKASLSIDVLLYVLDTNWYVDTVF